MSTRQEPPIDNRIIKTKYKNYDLLARFWNGSYRGRVWKNKTKVADYAGESIDLILESLVRIVDQHRQKQFENRTSEVLVMQDYINSWLEILPITDTGTISVLKRLARYKDHSSPISKLLRISGFESISALLTNLKQTDAVLRDELLLEFYAEPQKVMPLYTLIPNTDTSDLDQQILYIDDSWANSLLQADHLLLAESA